jgi:hypothetical protein
MNASGSARRTGLLLFGATVLGLLVLVASLPAGLGCGLEDSNCARAGTSHDWQGRVYTAAGLPARYSLVTYTFASQPSGKPVRLRTDERGRYCLRRPLEAVTVYVSVDLAPATAGAPLIVSPDVAGRYIDRDQATNTRVASVPWNPAVDSASQCATRPPPWFRIDSAGDNWHFLLMCFGSLGIFSLAAFAIPRVADTARRRRSAVVLLCLACANALLALLTYVLPSL